MTNREDAMIINSLVRQALTSAQEVMGENGLKELMTRAVAAATARSKELAK